MKVTYVGPHHEVEIPAADGLVVAHGETVDVPDEVARGLLAQGSSEDSDGKIIPPAEPTWIAAKTKDKKE